MIIEVKVIAPAKQNLIKTTDIDKCYKVYLTKAPQKGQANKKLLSFLADYFNLPKSNISILKGEYSKRKIIKVIFSKLQSPRAKIS